MTENIEPKPKNKGGRPRKEKTGKHIWIPAEFIDMVNAIVATGKQQRQQAKQATQ